ncbi:KAP family NTPase [Cupriavidus gilardii]|uniref:KAP family P-loop NTPase fold protein n=1 Tax=Cupriavidus gilardii TaxID=82541 RepID=UPI0021C11539|nr:KAP family NTPase [Cupriavidus gilardii]MCT9017046.1 KAP family NTPase [Cupriavidus gilardii]MCT9056719.1 KAP family NTPase [Cupriavidus gilardii]
MTKKRPAISPQPTTPFENDKLRRAASAEYLTEYLLGKHATRKERNDSNSFILNVNAPWGIGKTYFLTNWAESLRQRGYVVVVFDAWQNDYCEQPLIGFMSEVEEQLTSALGRTTKARASLTKLLDSGKKIVSVAPAIIAATAVKQLTGMTTDNIGDMATASAGEVAEKIRDKLYEQNKETKAAIASFKSSLSSIVTHFEEDSKSKLPIFFFVDELDRCRPNYAIELLETVKHLFGVNGVYFVIATDTEQLCASVNAVYGERFSADKYLRRFLHAEYTFPTLDNELYTDYLLSKFGLQNSDRLVTPSLSPKRTFNISPPNQNSSFFCAISDLFGLTLRDQEQTAEIIDAVFLTTGDRKFHFPALLTWAAIKQSRSDIFKDLYDSSARGLKKLQDSFKKDTHYVGHSDGRTSLKNLSDIVCRIVEWTHETQERLYERYNHISHSVDNAILGLALNQGTFGDYPELVSNASSISRGVKSV